MRVGIFLVLLVTSVALASCAPSNIGREVRYSQIFCKKGLGTCSGTVGDLYISYTIEKVGDEYEVRGSAKHEKGTTMTWHSYSDASFTIYLIYGSTIIDEIHVAGGSGGLDSAITFSRKFRSNEFDYSTVSYYMNVRG